MLDSIDVCLEKQLFRDKIGRYLHEDEFISPTIAPEEVVKMINEGNIHNSLHYLDKTNESIIKKAHSFKSKRKVKGVLQDTTESFIIMSCEAAIVYFSDQAIGMNTDNTYMNAAKN